MKEQENREYHVSAITHDNRRLGYSELRFKTHLGAIRFCKGQHHGYKALYSELKEKTKEFRISRVIEIIDDDIDIITVETNGCVEK